MYELLANNLETKGENDKTLTLLSKGLRVRTKVKGQDDVGVASLHYRIGKLQRDQGLDHEALASLQSGKEEVYNSEDICFALGD